MAISQYIVNNDTYLATVGLLLTTPENKTIINLHYKCLLELCADDTKALQREVVYLQRLLSCTNNRINKSSSLWLLYKKLYIQFNKTITFNVNTTLIKSAENHFSNYYAWNFARWYYINTTIEERSSLLTRTRYFCNTHFKDSAAWSAFMFMLLPIDDSHEKFLAENCLTDSLDHKSQPLEQEFVEKEVRSVINRIDILQCPEWSPFALVLAATKHMRGCPLHDIFVKWKQEINQYEAQNDTIKFFHRQPMFDKNDTNILSRQLFMHIAYKKTLLDKLLMFNEVVI
ncbi:unnamed protein product [Nakaseomyces glabratus]|uniref:Protein ECM9 n=1 Tax=Candida glabrata (strain ATCC 2001 / BCRC 20586 / JCM 3761 / NBRC 0622 / NRRL Y-65 / CBS 138) TaxID=284593 RepID=Q6FLM6_CANGA|nr:uncharacterized protein CAGL0L02255g [Nakaseomyces glabratus]CAG61838.2 unnamed protein product [Nakaseomyces glabratus]|eukprot:XP_448868.2 uncharacterized protein CAGL0L02255g [[Candida] glabrata]